MRFFTDAFLELKKADEPLYRVPKSVQETIEIMRIAENGIFEVAKNRYSKCYCFGDINYVTTGIMEQKEILQKYCQLLNSFDVNFKITINNKNKDMEQVRKEVFLQNKDDGFNHFRKAYNSIMEQKIQEGRQLIDYDFFFNKET